MGQTTLTESLGAIEAEIAAGQAERALARCQEIQTRYPRALAVQRVLGEAWLALRKPREALGALDRTLAGNPEDVRACCARAIVHQMHGDAAAALSWYRRACDVRPDDQALRATYLEMATQIGQPAYRPTRVGLARLYLRNGLFTHAIREWELLLAERPDLLDAQVGLVETLWRAGRQTQADEWAKRVLVNAPSCEKALLISAIIAHDAGQHEEAERLLQRVSLLDPDQRMAQAIFADRLAAGDRALSVLLWGPDAPEPQPPYSPPAPQTPPAPQRPGVTGGPTVSPTQPAPSAVFGRSPQPTSGPASVQPPFPSSSSQSGPRVARSSGPKTSGPVNERIIRPLVDSRPTPQTSGPIQRASSSGPMGLPGAGQPAAPVAATRTHPLPPRSSALPSTFGNIFKETEGMIWGADDTESFDRPDALGGLSGLDGADGFTGTGALEVYGAQTEATTGTLASGELTPSDAFARSTQFVPPMIAQHSAVMDDTEARQAINWVHWLQAQGARTIPSDGQPATGPLPGATGPLAGRMATPPPGLPPGMGQPARPSQPLTPQAQAQPQPPQPPVQSPQPNAALGRLPPQAQPPVGPSGAAPAAQGRVTVGPFTPPAPGWGNGATPRPPTAAPVSGWGQGAPAPTGRPQAPQAPAASVAPAPPPVASPPTSAPLTAQGIVIPPELTSRRTGPLPPPSPEALRSMFAQLEPAAQARDIVDADAIGVSGAVPVGVPVARAAPLSSPLAASTSAETRANSAPWPALSEWSAESSDEDAAPTPTSADAKAGVKAAPAEASSAAPAVTTLEELERGFAASGFEQFTPQPGALAALAAEPAHAETPTEPRMARVSALAIQSAETPPEPADAQAAAENAAAPQDEAPAPPIPSGPDPKDYAARLELARRKRGEGALDDAFVEYTAVLRNAPDLLPEVMSDLEALSAEESAHPEAHRLLGDARIRQGDYMSALESLNRATALTQAQEQGEG